MVSKLLSAMALTAALVFPFSTFADGDLPVNGDFRGRPAGYCPAPGWTLTADGGFARILPTRDRNEFELELRSGPNRSQSVLSDLHKLPGNILKLEFKVRGEGSASGGYEVFDEARRTLVAADRQTVGLARHDQKVKRYFIMPPQAKYIRLRLSAKPGSVAIFRDVEAEVARAAIPAVQKQEPPPTGMIAAPPAEAAGTVSAPTAAVTPLQPGVTAIRPPSRLLRDDRFYPYAALRPDEHFDVTLRAGSDIDFDLGERPDAGFYWKIVSYDPSICRIKLEHDRDGIFPLRRDKAEIELKALRRGSSDVVFTCGSKKVTVHLTAL